MTTNLAIPARHTGPGAIRGQPTIQRRIKPLLANMFHRMARSTGIKNIVANILSGVLFYYGQRW